MRFGECVCVWSGDGYVRRISSSSSSHPPDTLCALSNFFFFSVMDDDAVSVGVRSAATPPLYERYGEQLVTPTETPSSHSGTFGAAPSQLRVSRSPQTCRQRRDKAAQPSTPPPQSTQQIDELLRRQHVDRVYVCEVETSKRNAVIMSWRTLCDAVAKEMLSERGGLKSAELTNAVMDGRLGLGRLERMPPLIACPRSDTVDSWVTSHTPKLERESTTVSAGHSQVSESPGVSQARSSRYSSAADNSNLCSMELPRAEPAHGFSQGMLIASDSAPPVSLREGAENPNADIDYINCIESISHSAYQRSHPRRVASEDEFYPCVEASDDGVDIACEGPNDESTCNIETTECCQPTLASVSLLTPSHSAASPAHEYPQLASIERLLRELVHGQACCGDRPIPPPRDAPCRLPTSIGDRDPNHSFRNSCHSQQQSAKNFFPSTPSSWPFIADVNNLPAASTPRTPSCALAHHISQTIGHAFHSSYSPTPPESLAHHMQKPTPTSTSPPGRFAFPLFDPAHSANPCCETDRDCGLPQTAVAAPVSVSQRPRLPTPCYPYQQHVPGPNCSARRRASGFFSTACDGGCDVGGCLCHRYVVSDGVYFPWKGCTMSRSSSNSSGGGGGGSSAFTDPKRPISAASWLAAAEAVRKAHAQAKEKVSAEAESSTMTSTPSPATAALLGPEL